METILNALFSLNTLGLIQWFILFTIVSLLTIDSALCKDNPLLSAALAYYIQVTLVVVRVLYVLCLSFLFFIELVGPDAFIHYTDCFTNDFGLDTNSSSLSEYHFNSSFSIESHFTNFLDLLPTAYADMSTEPTLHRSFDTFIHDPTPGGVLITNYIKHIHSQNVLNIPLFLTDHGINHTTKLVDMINGLALITSTTQYTGDAVLLSFLTNNYSPTYNTNMHINSSVIEPLVLYDLPVSNTKMVIDGLNSGVYGFMSRTTPDSYLGSALAYSARLSNHMAMFKDPLHNNATRVHLWANNYNGAAGMKWAHLVDMPNLPLTWSRLHPTLILSKGGLSLMTCFAQFPIRILEQCMYTHYMPTLHPTGSIITFFNQKLNVNDFNLPKGYPDLYQAVDITRTIVYVQEDSQVKLANALGLTTTPIRANMNWHLPMKLTVNGNSFMGYVQEVGEPIRTIQVPLQMKPVDKYPEVILLGRTLNDLVPGKVYAIDPVTLKDVSIFDTAKEM